MQVHPRDHQTEAQKGENGEQENLHSSVVAELEESWGGSAQMELLYT